MSTTTINIEGLAEVKRSLESIGLTPDQVIRIAKAAAAARSEYLPDVDPINYPGMQANHAGIRQLRLQTLPANWRPANFRNIEVVVSDDLGIMIGFQNVDRACKVEEPQAISPKGGAAREMVAKPYSASLFSDENVGADRYVGSFPIVWLVCVSASLKRLEVEVSRPRPFEGSCFDGFFERIFVADEEMDSTAIASAPLAPEVEEDFDILISKK